MIIDVKNLVKKYKDVVAVDGVSLEIEEGEIFGLLGPNGAGKTTTISALLGLIQLNSGTVNICGKTFKHNSRDIKSKMGYVPQDFAFFEELSAIDNVTYWGRLYGLKGEELKNAVKEALDFTGLWEKRKGKPKTFSGGMKRRLNIACGIVHKPKILFMDEPTVGVDPQSRNNILESIKTLNKNGTTVIYTSHYMEEIEAICSRVAIMDFGKVIALGTIDELIKDNFKEQIINVEFSTNTDDAINTIKNLEDVTSIEKDGEQVLIKFTGDFDKLLEKIVKANVGIKGLALEKANLETVFLKLTGKKLRD